MRQRAKPGTFPSETNINGPEADVGSALAAGHGIVRRCGQMMREVAFDPLGPMLKIWPIIILHFVALAVLEDR
jgi:hypothetical protein